MLRALTAILLLSVPVLASGAKSPWLERVAPVITSAEKKTYLALPPSDRAKFEESFWADKAISAAEYSQRVEYIDSAFGSGRPGSGANTDQGRVYLSLGAPNRVTRVPSSRIFVPIEIWYYDTVPGVIQTELRLMFFQMNSVGLPRLYSPTADTIRALLLPQAGTKGMFGPNDNVTESDIRRILKTGPAEDEAIAAAVGVASGIKYSGNDEILGRVASPEFMLRRASRTEVSARLITSHPALQVLQTVSAFGGSQVDLRLSITAQREIDIEVQQGVATVYANQLRLKFAKPEPVDYTHRLDLLPGSYRIIFTADGKSFAYPLEVSPRMGEILRADFGGEVQGRETPFEFDGRQIVLNDIGKFAIVAVPEPCRITWIARKGSDVVWRAVTNADRVAITEMPAGSYRLEAVTEYDSRSADVSVSPGVALHAESNSISLNANLHPARRAAFIGHQWLLRGNLEAARASLNASMAKGITDEAEIELARADALGGNLDDARERVRRVLGRSPDNFEAISVFAFIEARFQDYAVAAELYRRALAVHDSAELRTALEKLPAR